MSINTSNNFPYCCQQIDNVQNKWKDCNSCDQSKFYCSMINDKNLCEGSTGNINKYCQWSSKILSSDKIPRGSEKVGNKTPNSPRPPIPNNGCINKPDAPQFATQINCDDSITNLHCTSNNGVQQIIATPQNFGILQSSNSGNGSGLNPLQHDVLSTSFGSSIPFSPNYPIHREAVRSKINRNILFSIIVLIIFIIFLAIFYFGFLKNRRKWKKPL